MPGARTVVTALVALTIVDVFHTIVALAAYEHRIGVVTHDGSGTVDMLDTIVPLRELSSAMFWLLLLTLLATAAGFANWVIRARFTEPPVEPTTPVTRWRRMSAVVAVPLNLIAAVQYLYASAHGGEYMRTVLAQTTLLLVAASVALVVATTTGIQVVRRTAATRQHTAGVGATTA